MRSRILQLFKQTTSLNPKLGRWAFHHHKENSLKIKYANEDNCGVSGNILVKNKLDDKYIYSMGYESVHN